MKKTTFADFKKQWYFSLTEYCSWKCSYCDFPCKTDPKVAPIEYVEEVFDRIKRITNYDQSIEYCLEGGEIGLFDQDYLDRVFNSGLSETYNVATNGLFMEKSYHKRYSDKIHYILYHIAPEIYDGVKYKEYDFGDILCYYTFVINKNNLPILDKFLTDNLDSKHRFLPHILQPRTPGLDLLTYDDFIQMYDIIKDKSNVKPDFIERVVRIIERHNDEPWLDSHRKICASVYTQPIFDLPNKRVNRCCISITGDSVDITDDNLERLYKNKIMFSSLKDSVCDGCIANFLWHDWRHRRYMKEIIKIHKGFSS